MDKLLQALMDLLQPIYQDSPVWKLHAVKILSAYEQNTLLKTDHIPCLLIMPVGERFETGPMASSGRMVYTLKLRIVTRSHNPNKYRTAEPYNMYALTDSIRNTLLANKKLVSDDYERCLWGMRLTWITQDIDQMYANGGSFTARDITIEYEHIEAYTGSRNNQVNNQLPQGALVPC